MLRNRFAWALAGTLLAGVASAQSLDEILEKNYAARGGKDKLKAVQSMQLSGHMTMGPGAEAPFAMKWQRPDKVRLEFTFQGMTGIQAYDGKIGWSVMPFMGKTDPEKMSEEQLQEIQDTADDAFEGALFNYKDKGTQIEALGKGDIEGTAAYKLKVTKKNGDVATYYLDADSGLEIKVEGKTKRRGQEVEFETSLGDYKDEGGILMAHSIESKPKGAPQGQMITVEKVELNAKLSAPDFAMPAPKPAEPAKPTAEPAKPAKPPVGGRG